MRTIWKHLNDQLKSSGFLGLVNPMPYNVHAVYNVFKHGWSEYGQLISSIGSRHTQPAKKDYFKM